jgi:hypothetical protein
VLFLVLAIWSRLGTSRLTRPWLVLRRLLARPSYPDAFVALTLIAWWILGPVYYDDGWVTARQANSLDSGGFSNYFDNYAANLPFGTWFEWLQHLLVGHTTALVIQRIPSVACLASLWLVSRAILSRLVGSPSRSGNVAWWSSALAFCIGAAAFGVTLRPEPLNALLVGGVLLCGVRFAARPAIAPLAAGAVVTGLALSEHPEGVVALAPLLVCVPRIVREVRRRTSITCGGVLAVLVCGVAWTVLLGFLDSDLYHRLADARLFREGEGHSGGVISEWLRYQALWWSSSPRREFVVVCLLCVLALLRRRPRRLEERLPSASLGLGLLLLAFVPSKWAWEFGVLIGLSAVAVGTEVARFASALSTQRRSFVPLVFGFLAVASTLAWAGSTPARWGPLDLWTTSHVYFAAGAAIYALWAIFVLFGIAVAAALRRRDVAARLSRQAATLSLAFVLAPVLVLTTLVFSVDTLATPGWTYARQSVAVLAGRSTCGLADYLVVPDSRSMTAMARIGPSPHRTVAGGAPSAPLAGVDVLGVGSPGGRSMVHSRWYRVAGGDRALGFYAGGTWRRSESLVVVWGRVRGGRVVQAGMGSVKLSKLARRGPEPASWRFVAQTQLPQKPRGADALRLRIIGAADGVRGAFVTGPIAYSDVSLRARIGRSSTATLVSPFLLESMPCARLPAVELGVGQPPALLVDWSLPPFMTDPKGPFGAIPDLFQLRRLPLADSPQRPRPREVSVYEAAVDSRDALLPIERLTPESR